MQAIETKFHGPTNHRGARITATCQSRTRGVTTPYAYEASVDGAHDFAAITMIRAMEWFGVWARGHKADGKGCVYVCLYRYFPERDWSPPQGLDLRDTLTVRS